MTVPPEWAGGVGRWIGIGSNLEIGEVLAKTVGIKFSMPAFCCRFGAAACAAVGGCGGRPSYRRLCGGRFRAADSDPISRLQLPGDVEKWI